MVDWTSLTTPVEGGWQMGGAGTSAGLLAPNSGLYPYLGDIGAGLLAASGPSVAPQGGLGARFGGAMQYAGQRQSERLINDARREALTAAAAQRQAEAKFREALTGGGTPDALKTAAAAAYPEVLAKSLFPTPMDARDQAAILQTQATLLKIQQELGEGKAGAMTPSAATARAVGTLADVFDTAEKEGNPFAPGSTFGSASLLGKYGLGPDMAVSAPDEALAPFGDPATLKRQAAQAILIDKETATISQNLTQLAEKGTGRSATALNNLNTALGAGNVPIPVRRKVILSTLETVIDDVTARGNEVPQEWITLRDRLAKQTENITKGGQSPAPPPVGYSPGAPDGGIVPQPPSVYTPLPPAQAGAGPAAPTPLVPSTPVTTLPLNAQGIPSFKRKADLDRAEKTGKLKGVTAIELDGKVYDWVPE